MENKIPKHIAIIMDGNVRTTLPSFCGTRPKSAIAIERSISFNMFLSNGLIISCLPSTTEILASAGTGNPYFSTDTTAALRASEIKADVVFLLPLKYWIIDSTVS